MAYLKLAAALIFVSGLMIYPADCAEAARSAMASWAFSVAPAVFPFASVMPFLTCAEARGIYDKLFGRVIWKLFRLPGSAASAIVAGLVSGSPGGALAVARVAGEEKLTRGQTARLAGIACGVSPVYALSVMGVSIGGSAAVGWRLVIAQLASQFFVGLLFRNVFVSEDKITAIGGQAEIRPIAGAVGAALRVCGYMIAFSVGISLAEKLVGAYIWRVAAFIDLPSGAPVCEKGVVSAAALGFGGACIGFQNIGVLKDMVKPSVYFVQKAAGAIACAGIYMALDGVMLVDETMVFVDENRIFEVNMLLFVGIIAPVLLIFLGKRSKKHFS